MASPRVRVCTGAGTPSICGRAWVMAAASVSLVEKALGFLPRLPDSPADIDALGSASWLTVPVNKGTCCCSGAATGSEAALDCSRATGLLGDCNGKVPGWTC